MTKWPRQVALYGKPHSIGFNCLYCQSHFLGIVYLTFVLHQSIWFSLAVSILLSKSKLIVGKMYDTAACRQILRFSALKVLL